jgi:hypothetical protein
VLDRGPESLDGLAGEIASTEVDDRHRDEQRKVGRDLFDGGDGGLAVEGVEDRLDEEEVDASFDQRACGLRVAIAELVEGDLAIGRVVDPRRQGESDVGRAERTGDEAIFESVGSSRGSSHRRSPRGRSPLGTPGSP